MPYTSDPNVRSRWTTFAKSGECISTLLLIAYFFVLLAPGDTFRAIPQFALLRDVADGRGGETFWSAWCVTLAMLQLCAVAFSDSTVRGITVLGAGVFFSYLGYALWLASPIGFGWPTFAGIGAWLLLRAVALLVSAVRA